MSIIGMLVMKSVCIFDVRYERSLVPAAFTIPECGGRIQEW